MRATELIQVIELVLQGLGHLVERAEGVVIADRSAVTGRSVVPGDVDDQGILQHTHVLDGLDDPADLVVSRLGESAKTS